MDNNQQNTNNQSTTGISGFGIPASSNQNNPGEVKLPEQFSTPVPAPIVPSSQPMQTSSIQGFPEVKPIEPVMPSALQAPTATPMTSPAFTTPIQPSTPTTAPVIPIITPAPVTPSIPPISPLDMKTNFPQQNIMGGVEEPMVKAKPKFSMSSLMGSSHKEPVAAPQGGDMPPTTTAPAFNEVTSSGSKNKFALIAIIVGVVLLLVAAAGYYYLTILNKPEETVVEEVPVVQEQVELPPADASAIEQDPFVIQMNQLESTASSEPSSLRNQIQSIDFGTVDSEITSGQTQEMEMEQMPPIQ